jgi:sterol desaturase/sphingolipid hydroxylase (fatty acid hydroxylase superfamily)
VGPRTRRPAWQLSRAEYYVDFFTTPLLAIPVVAVALRGDFKPLAAATGLVAGYIAWTIAEYVIHRFVFHRSYRREHWAHHVRPADYIGANPRLTFALLNLVCGVLVVILGDNFGAAAALGLLGGYFSYIVVHDRIHHEPQAKWPRSIWRRQRAAHSLHHSGVEANFGVVHPLWDFVFRTYRAP